MKRVKIRAGEYRVGDYVVIREDVPSIGDRDLPDGSVEYEVGPLDVTWGVIPGDFYDRQRGNVGLPDSVYDSPTLSRAVAWIESQP